jgi:hypothetical protein
MKMSEEFPSKWLKAADLQGREVKVIMSNCERETIGDDQKPVLYFKGKEKGVVLNKTNAQVIADFYGDDTADWYDQPIILFSVMTEFQGRATPGLRVRVPTAKDNRPPTPRREDPISSGPLAQTKAPVVEMDDDSIPF